jgi:hypothetical protein
MKIKIEILNGECVLTDETENRLPVIVSLGVVYGPSDYVVVSHDSSGVEAISAFDAVVGWLEQNEGATYDQKILCQQFISMNPNAPQIVIEPDGSIKNYPSMPRFKDYISEVLFNYGNRN